MVKWLRICCWPKAVMDAAEHVRTITVAVSVTLGEPCCPVESKDEIICGGVETWAGCCMGVCCTEEGGGRDDRESFRGQVVDSEWSRVSQGYCLLFAICVGRLAK